jgi:FkbM family methyltransferase
MILTTLWTWLSQSRLIAHAAVKLGNQCNAIASRYLSNSSDPAVNGETRLISTLGPELTLVIDVGANVGDWTASILEYSPRCEVILFEPSSACVARLHARFPERVTVRSVALSDEIGNKPFAAEKSFGTSSALLSGYVNHKEYTVETVSVSTLDAQFPAPSRMIDLLKIDTEGFDLHVLRGAINLLTTHRVRFLQFEYSYFWSHQGSTLDAAFTLLRNSGYDIYLLNDRGLHAFDLSKWRRWFDYGNFVACTEENRSKLLPLMAALAL